MIIDVKWPQLRDFAASRYLSIQYVDIDSNYHIATADGYFSLRCVLPQDQPSDDLTEFETQYKPTANAIVQETDLNGRVIYRAAATIKGWHYQLLTVDMTLAKIGGAICQRYTGTDTGYASVQLYDGSATLVTDPGLESTVVRTKITLAPDYSYEIIGAIFGQSAAPTEAVKLQVIGVPGIANVQFTCGYIDLRHAGSGIYQLADGRATKYLQHVPGVPVANAMQFDFQHPAGLQHECMISMEIYKAP